MWRTVLRLPATPSVVFYKAFLRSGGALSHWQDGANTMLVLPSPGDMPPGCTLIAESHWGGQASASTRASGARVAERLAATEAVVGTAEAAAYAAGSVARTVMAELLTAREETAVARRFIRAKGFESEFEATSGAEGVFSSLGDNRGSAGAIGGGWRSAGGGGGGARTAADIEAEIEDTLKAQLSGEMELRRDAR